MKKQWYMLDWNGQYQSIINRIQSNIFLNKSERGFILEETRPDYIKGNFIRKNEFQIISNDPFGNEIINNNIRYDFIKFILFPNVIGLELENPPISLNFFLNEIAFFSNYNVSIKKPDIDVIKWINNLENNLEDVKIIRIALSDIPLSNNASQSVIITSNDDVRQYMKEMKIFKTKKAQITFKGNHGIAKAELSNSGNIIANEKDFNIIGNPARHGLQRLIEERNT